jgi:hypothetical protein
MRRLDCIYMEEDLGVCCKNSLPQCNLCKDYKKRLSPIITTAIIIATFAVTITAIWILLKML